MKFRIEYKDITTYSGIVETKDKEGAKKRIRENPFNQKDVEIIMGEIDIVHVEEVSDDE